MSHDLSIKEESPYKPETTLLCVIARINLLFAPIIAPKEFTTPREPTAYARA